MPFPESICPKVFVIARLEFELAYYDPAVHRFNHYTPGTPTKSSLFFGQFSSLIASTKLYDYDEPQNLSMFHHYCNSTIFQIILI